MKPPRGGVECAFFGHNDERGELAETITVDGEAAQVDSSAATIPEADDPRRLGALALVAPGESGCWRFDLRRADLLKFWRNAKPWADYT